MSRFNMPSKMEDLREMVKQYQVLDPPSEDKIVPIIINDKDNLVLADELNKTYDFLINLKSKFTEKKEDIENLIDTENNLQNIDSMYKNNSRKMNNELFDIQKADSVNKRMIEFYSKDYGLKSVLKKYLKYIYYILVVALVLLLIYKKQHKNKKILGFLLFVIIFPIIILRFIFDRIVKNIGHFKLDILYTFFIFIIIGIGYGGFKIVKKLLKIITTPVVGSNNISSLPKPDAKIDTKPDAKIDTKIDTKINKK